MKSPMFPVSLVTAVLVLYTGLIALGGSYALIIAIFTASPFLVIWMVYRVLKSTPLSDKTFNDHFYEDLPYRKIPDEAENA